MKHTRISRNYVFLLSCMLFGSSQVLPAAESDLNDDEPSINQSQGLSYVCFDKSMSDIADVITQISALDTDLNSPVSQLKHHIDNGYMLGLRDEVLDVLEYAEWFVARHTDEKVKGLVAPQLDKIIEQVLQGELDMSEQEIMRSSDLRLIINSKARFKEDVRMDKKLYVHGKAHFDKDVEFKDDVKIKDDLTVKGDLVVEGTLSASDLFIADISVGDATISGTLSVQEEVVGCDLTVGCNININNSTSAAIGNINKAGSSFVHNFGTENTFVGIDAGNFTMSGTNNVGVGVSALNANTAGDFNVAVGHIALAENTTGLFNVAVGAFALKINTTGGFNVSVGARALGLNTIGNNNTALGYGTLEFNTTGSENVAVGRQALRLNTTGAGNIGVGVGALTLNATGEHNVAIGFEAGNLVLGSRNTFVGDAAGAMLTNGDNNIYVGNLAGFSGSESDTTRIGNTQAQTFIAGVRATMTSVADAIPVLIDSNGQLGTISSSKRFKHNIESMKNKSERIYDLNPVEFVYNKDASESKQYGLIAEEVAQVFPELVVNEQDGTPYTVRYEVLPVLLLNEMQKIAQKVAIIDEMNEQIITLNETVDHIKQHIEKIIIRQ